jgi:hypothetical protein
MTGLSAPSSRSAVALLNAAKPSIGRYCIIKYTFNLRIGNNNRRETWLIMTKYKSFELQGSTIPP